VDFIKKNIDIHIIKTRDWAIVNSIVSNQKQVHILFIKKGKLILQFKDTSMILSSNELIVIPQKTLLYNIQGERNLDAQVLSLSLSYIFNEVTAFPSNFFILQLFHTEGYKLSFDKKERTLIYGLFKLFNQKNISYNLNHNNTQLKLKGLELLLWILYAKYIIKYPAPNTPSSRALELTHNFFKSLSREYKNSHKVKSYAARLFITPDHLYKTIKQTMGKPPKYYIRLNLIKEAIRLLQYDNSIESISYELGYKSASYFSKHFKEYTSLSPTEYRKEMI